MSIAHLLDDFGAYARGDFLAISDVALEDARLEAFEKGYQAGWDDSMKSQTEDARRITADLAQNLQDLHFTYEEAFASVLAALRPLFEQVTATVLPRLSAATLGQRLIEILHDLARKHGRQPIQIVGAPADILALESILTDLGDPSVDLTEDDTLVSGQIYLRFGEAEQQIDMQDVLQGIDDAISGFFEQNRRVSA
ncbi:MAG: flagellar biosynthesis protein [Rhodobacteraceae bacterium CG17_big_fil_post_rev_8_21_14_2_50_63_15]|nr:flagellar biosynthesis protein [Roseovarius sp.]PIV77297.1 MAG: flagellar biosynthesis protein [Rhodobacteraceae bacterium CG17_big_fil_post_rev_8_21_14_2_50_63_15]